MKGDNTMIKINTDHGYITINEQSFPWSQKDFKKLLMYIHKYSYLNNTDLIIKQLYIALDKRHLVYNAYSGNKTKLKTIKRQFELLDQEKR